MFKGEKKDAKSGDKETVALKKLNMINEKDGVTLMPLIFKVSHHCIERN